MKTQKLKGQLRKLASHREPTVLYPNQNITVELNGKVWKTGTVQEIANHFNIDLFLLDPLTREGFGNTLKGRTGKVDIDIKLGYRNL